jgi:hypothetical protein
VSAEISHLYDRSSNKNIRTQSLKDVLGRNECPEGEGLGGGGGGYGCGSSCGLVCVVYIYCIVLRWIALDCVIFIPNGIGL